MIAQYKCRYFFDPGAGVCLWSANDEANKRFDYAVNLDELHLPDNLLREAIHLITWFDTSIDWSNPSGPSPWSADERQRFNDAAQVLLGHFRQQLGSEFEIKDESHSVAT